MKHYLIALLLLISIEVHSQQSLIGYAHNWNSQDVAWIHPQNIDARYSVLIVAFAMPASNTDMTMSFTPENMSQSAFKQAIAQLKNQGKKVLISIGGATASLDFPDDNAKSTFVNSMNAIMDTYDFDGIDIDIEHGNCILITGGTIANPTNASQIRLIDAIKSIMNHHRSSKNSKMYLTMAPETAYVQGGQSGFGSIWGGYLPMIHALRDSIDVLQVQLYNSGTMYGIDGKIYSQGTADFIIAMTEAVIQGFSTAGGLFNGLPASKVAVGLPACNSAAGGGYVDTATVTKAMKYIMGKGSKPGTYSLFSSSGYPSLKGMMTWSINWDAKEQCDGAYSFATMYQKLFINSPEPPSQVTLIAPQFGQKISEDTVKFRWNKQANAMYHIEIMLGGTIVKSDSSLTDTIYNISNLAYSQLHTWKVRAKNTQGWGQWSGLWTFTSRDLPKPNQIMLLSPLSNSIVKKDSKILFKWNSATPNVNSYIFTLKKGNVLVHSKSDIKDTVYNYVLNDFDEIYSWSVQAVNASGSGSPSEFRIIKTFPKPLELPHTVPLIAPLKEEIRTDTITFIWAKGNPEIQRYHLRVFLDESILIDDSTIVDTMFTLIMPEKSGNVQWSVRAFNSSGYGSWNMSDSMRYNRLPPLPKTPVFVNTLDSLTIPTDTFNLAWTTIQHAESYELRVLHTDSQFNHDTIVQSSGLTLRNLKNNHLYQVQVRAANERGYSEWSLPVYIRVVLSISSMGERFNDKDIIVNNSIIKVNSLHALPSQFRIFSIDGSCKVSSTITELPYYFPIQELSRGFYFYTLGTLMQPFLIY